MYISTNFTSCPVFKFRSQFQSKSSYTNFSYMSNFVDTVDSITALLLADSFETEKTQSKNLIPTLC